MITLNNNLTKAIDYSQRAKWYKQPKITKEFDTFYIYSTMYFGINEGDPDYATLDNAEMLAGIDIEHAIKSSVFEESTVCPTVTSLPHSITTSRTSITVARSLSQGTARVLPSSASC